MEVRIEKIVAGGDGLARREGRIVFVPGTAPGERHLVETVLEKKDFLRARSVALVESSPQRRPEPCPHARACGGCALMHLSPPAQLAARTSILLEGLERALGAPYSGPLRVRSGEELSYRNRLRFHVVLTEKGPLAGFRRRGSREIVDIERCLLGTSSLAACWRRIRATISADRRLARSLVSVELEESTSDPGRIAARFFVSSTDGLRWLDSSRREALVAELGLQGLEAAVARGGPVVRSGRPFVEHRVAGLSFRQSLGSFFQSNRLLLQDLVDAVLEGLGEESGDRALDLFCGVGLFTLPLAARFASVVGVESETSALRDARANAKLNQVANVRFLRSDASRYAARARLREDDFVLLDPPRGGLAPPLVESLGGSPLRRFRYLSCDPPALFRDASRLARYGFTIETLTLLDLFPNTHHFEILASLARRS